jgi:RNA polymerase sigma factor (sigma-70 family)
MFPAERAALLDRAARGDSDAFAQLIAPHREALVRFAGRQLGERAHLGEDAVQEAMVNAYGALAAGARPENLRAWLFTIVRNCAVNIRRAQRPTDPLPAVWDSGGPDTVALLEQREWMDGLMSAIGDLPDRQREVLVGHTFEGRSYRELAERHSTTVPAVKTLIHRARRGLTTGSWIRQALLPPWGWPGPGIYRLIGQGKFAVKAAIKPLLISPAAQMLGAATIASTVLLAIPGTRPGPAIATPIHHRHAGVHGHRSPGDRHSGLRDGQSFTPAAERREAHRAIVSCERGYHIPKGRSPAALRYALKHLPTSLREYTDCEDEIKRALHGSRAGRREHRSG